MNDSQSTPKNRNILIGIVAVISVLGTLFLFGSGAVRVGDVFNSLEDANPRVIGFMALPFIVVIVVIGRLWYRKREERMWKQAIRKTQATRQEPGDH